MYSQPTTPKKKPTCLARLLTWVIIFAILLVAANYLYPLVMQKYGEVRSQHALPEPDWALYDAYNQEPQFALVKINDGLVHGEYTGEDENFFFKNRLSVFGWDSSYEECKTTEYKCGDGDWAMFDETTSRLLSNRCMVRIGPNDFCTILLPDGSLINATNYASRIGLTDALFYEEGLVIQVVMDATSITVKQGLTRQESMLWHIVRPNSPMTYRVEIGDKVVEDIGTTFGTHSALKNDWVAAVVTKGSVQVISLDPANTVTVTDGLYYRSTAFDTSLCPVSLKACGNSCIPANGVCCPEATGASYCLSPLKCGDNLSKKCTSNLFFGAPSANCCVSSSAFADDLTLMNRGSTDCPTGSKMCGGMRCIPEDQPCCYPTDDDCPVPPAEPEVLSIPEDVNIPRAYLNNAYAALLGSPTYQEIMAHPDFMSDYTSLVDVRNFIQDELRKKLAADEKASDPIKETAQYCSKYPNNCVTNSSSSSESSGSSAGCPSTMPSNLQCSCGKHDSRGWVYCVSPSGSLAGDWYIPLNCLQAKGICN